MKLLIVDDEEMVRYVLTEKLGESGFNTVEACDGREAVALFGEGGFDAVLLDLKMPGMDGIETLKELRRADPAVPVIMVTAFGDIATAVESIKLGAYDFVEKPPQISRIVVTLRRAIEKAALEREVRALGKSVEESTLTRQAYQKLKELDQIKTAFLSSVSHELRTPLTSIIGYADLNRAKLTKLSQKIGEGDPKLSGELARLAENMEILTVETGKLSGMIESILDLTAMEAGTAEWRWEPFDVAGVVKRAALEFAPRAEEKKLAFEVEVEEGLPVIKGDLYRISQVVGHLLSNALKFTEAGSIKIDASLKGRKIVVSVEDTGQGVPESKQEAIFEKFIQLGETLSDKPKGAGLGLPICKLIIAYHGGTLSVESPPGGGSRFYFTLQVEGDASQ